MSEGKGGAPPGDVMDVDVPSEELRRLACVEALLRLVAARDRREAIALAELEVADPVDIGRSAKW